MRRRFVEAFTLERTENTSLSAEAPEPGWVDARFRYVFAVAAAALVAINAGVAASVLYEQRQMRDVAFGLYDRAFTATNEINEARVQFQRFVDRRETVSGLPAITTANQLLDPVVNALDEAADHASEPAVRQQRLAARMDVLGFEADFADSGPAVWARLKKVRATLDDIAAGALARGFAARGEIARTAQRCTELLIGSIVGGGALGLTILILLRRSVTLSAASKLSRLANFDTVTGLPNRNLLQRRITERLEGLRRTDRRFAVLSIDLDRFKQVNDTLGHAVGDRVLKEAGERIRAIARAEDLAARFGGDEFVLMVRDLVDPIQAAIVAERLVAALGAPYEFDGLRVLSGASVGIALAPQHGATVEDLLRNSDLALRQAKTAGKGQHRFFEEALNATLQSRRLMEIDLREALDRDLIEVHYQPVIEVAGGAVVASEALARWRRLGHGFVSPAEFIPLAEETGLIERLGEAVLRKACREATRWPAEVRVSVNLSVRQFQTADLVERVENALRDTGLPASRLELEVTESILIADKSRVLEALNRFRDLGVSIALDDFGTGFSSLSYLSSFPFDRIKIDRSFVTRVGERPEAAAIVRAVASLARTLGMSTTAEGVESQEDLDWLRRHGCDHAQGYLISRPIPPEDFRALLAERRRVRDGAAAA